MGLNVWSDDSEWDTITAFRVWDGSRWATPSEGRIWDGDSWEDLRDDADVVWAEIDSHEPVNSDHQFYLPGFKTWVFDRGGYDLSFSSLGKMETIFVGSGGPCGTGWWRVVNVGNNTYDYYFNGGGGGSGGVVFADMDVSFTSPYRLQVNFGLFSRGDGSVNINSTRFVFGSNIIMFAGGGGWGGGAHNETSPNFNNGGFSGNGSGGGGAQGRGGGASGPISRNIDGDIFTYTLHGNRGGATTAWANTGGGGGGGPGGVGGQGLGDNNSSEFSTNFATRRNSGPGGAAINLRGHWYGGGGNGVMRKVRLAPFQSSTVFNTDAATLIGTDLRYPGRGASSFTASRVNTSSSNINVSNFDNQRGIAIFRSKVQPF